MISCPTYHCCLAPFMSFAVKCLVQVARTDSNMKMITTKNVQALKIGEILYAILFLTYKCSLSAYTERYSSLILLCQKS